MNVPTGNERDSGASDEVQIDRDSGMNGHRRAGPVFKYGLVVGFVLLYMRPNFYTTWGIQGSFRSRSTGSNPHRKTAATTFC